MRTLPVLQENRGLPFVVDLFLDPVTAAGLRSQSQIARRMTEDWAARNLYCLSCPSNDLNAEKAGTPVRDFTCSKCGATYQLKSKNGHHGNVVANSAYHPKIAAIREGRAPTYAFLNYDRHSLKVSNLFVVPGHFITESAIQARTPLPPSARRAGWIGSNILLSKLAPDGRISLVSDGIATDPKTTRELWRKFRFLNTDPAAAGGWGSEVLAAVREIQVATQTGQFTLQAFYEMFADDLASRHPENLHVYAKIRQQLQLLRNHGVLEFLGGGRYRIIG